MTALSESRVLYGPQPILRPSDHRPRLTGGLDVLTVYQGPAGQRNSASSGINIASTAPTSPHR